MKKRVISLALVLVLALSLCVPASAADIRTVNTTITYREVSIIINGVEIAPCDENGDPTEPFIMNNTTYLPVRAIANALGLKVGWDAATSTVVLESGGEVNYGSGEPAATKATKSVDITYRGTKLSLDGEPVALVNANGEAVEPFILDGTNYLPLRIVGEALGLDVAWDSATSTVTLTEKAENGYWLVSKQSSTVSAEGFYTNETVKYSYDRFGNMLSESYTNSNGESYVFSYAYNSTGNLIDEKYIDSTGYSYSHTYTYNDVGTLIIDRFSDSEGELLAYVYNDKGLLVEEEEIAGIEGGANILRKYSYNDNGDVIEIYSYFRHSGDSYGINTYEYDEWGRVTKEATFEVWGDWRYESVFEYSYAENVCYASFMNSEGEAWQRVTTSEYDSEGRLKKEIEVTDYGEGETDTRQAIYSYDEGGRLCYLMDERSQYILTCQYDEDGRLVYYCTNRPSVEMFYEYNEDGLLVSESSQTSKDGRKSYRYEYDSFGRVIHVEYMSAIVNPEEYSYDIVYNSNGLIEEVAFTQNEITILLACTNDSNGNMIRIEGEAEGVKSVLEYEYVFITE